MLDVPSDKWEGLDGLGEEAMEELRPRAEAVVKAAGLYFAGEIKTTLTGARSGRTYKVSKTGQLHVASAPGEPPAVLMGALRNSIGSSEPVWEGDAVSVEIGPGIGTTPGGGDQDPADSYARRMEMGGADSRGIMIEPRPYMAPTELRVTPVIDAMLKAEL